MRVLFAQLGIVLFWMVCSALPASAEELKVLFLGDNGAHRPRQRFEQLEPAMAERGIRLKYTDQISDLNTSNLKAYNALLLYANIDRIDPEPAKALLDYVTDGGGFVPLHCASFCFRNSPELVDLIGGQFQRHGGEVFRVENVMPQHPIMQGLTGFESWDETYIHTKHNEKDRLVLEVRRQGGQAQGKTEEPWTWVRTHGKGRVFYTAWGHDQRTFSNAGFHALVERGIRWAAGSAVFLVAEKRVFQDPEMTPPRTDLAPFDFEEVGPKIPNYLSGQRWGSQGQVFTKMQKPLPPAESVKHYIVPKGFHLELFLSEPDIQGKPMSMNWDPKGRLWICETVDYPNELKPPDTGRDRIRICEDTNGDGRADKFTIFAENVSIPSAIEFCRDGIIIQAGIETLFLRDNDGDGKADQREKLITGWAMNDTHGGVSNFQYGLDNRYWAMQGYNNSRPKFSEGQHPGFRQGPFAFTVGGSVSKPDVTALEFIRSTNNNSWGLGTTEEGLVFASTANGVPSVFIAIPNRYYERVRGWTPQLVAERISKDHLFAPATKNVRQVDWHGGYTAGAGHSIYTARTYPMNWWNRTAFVCEPTGHLVGTFVLDRDGANYKSDNRYNLVASDDEWSSPIMAEVGPDGNVWIIDWYNYIIQHNPTPTGFRTGRGAAYESDLRDKSHGRIYRLVYDGAEGEPNASKAPNLDLNDPKSLVAGLSHSNRLWRRHAQRLLVERGKRDVDEQLIGLIKSPTVDSIGNNVGAIHALWTLHGLGALKSAEGAAFDAAVSALRHVSAGVRRNAALVLPASEGSVDALLAAKVALDDDLQVRLASLMALADMPTNEKAGKAISQLSGIAENLNDRYLGEAIVFAAAKHANPFLTGILVSQISAPSQEKQSNVVRVVAEHLARSGMNAGAAEALLTQLAESKSPAQRAIIEGLVAGWPTDAKTGFLTAGLERALVKLVKESPAVEVGPLLRLGTLWGSTELETYSQKMTVEVLAKLQNSGLSSNDRISAAQELVGVSGSKPETITKLISMITPQMDPKVASGIIRSMANATASNLAEELLKGWNTMTPAVRTDTITVLMARPATTTAMLGAIRNQQIAFSDLTLDQRQTLANHPNQMIRRQAEQLSQAAGTAINSARQEVINQFAAATKDTGNGSRGKELFVKNCGVCHKHSGEGKEIGPDLTGMAVHPKEELLVHILDPSRSVEGNFRRYTLSTLNGKVIAGMLAAESLSAVELVDAEGKRQTISREDIEQLVSSNKSVMPEGIEQQINVAQMTDLLEFMTIKGRFVPLPLSRVATAVSSKPMFRGDANGADQLILSDWSSKEIAGVPFQLIDPQGDLRPNVVLLNSRGGPVPSKMPRSVSVPCNMTINQFHLLSGISGWGHPVTKEQTVSMIFSIHYADGQVEEHELKNGVHFADYSRKVDVPGSTYAFAAGDKQVRYLSIHPKQRKQIASVELKKGADESAPLVMAITAEQYQ